MSLLLAAEDLTYTYPNADEASILGLSLAIYSNDDLAIVGAGGSGKSTLAKLLSGIVTPDSGTVAVFPAPGTYPRPAIVFQNPENQLVGTTVEEDIAFGPGNLALDPRVIRQRVEEVVELCGLTHLRRRQVHTLSGGEKQRVAIAGALALHPLCLILDEATAMLDGAAKEELQRAVDNVKQEYGTAVIRMTHSPQESLTANKVVVLHRGTIVATGKPEDVLWDPAQLDKWELETPPLYQAARILQQHGYQKCRNARTPKELALKLCRSFSIK